MNLQSNIIYLGLGPKNKLWDILVKMIYQATSAEPMWNVQHDEHKVYKNNFFYQNLVCKVKPVQFLAIQRTYG